MSTSKLLGAVCAGALLLTAGCAKTPQTHINSIGGETVTTTERMPLAVLDERAGQVVAVTFAFDRDTLDQKARSILDDQAAWMAERPEFHFSVTGHADKVGNPAYNLDLGQRRAERVVAYLIAAGIERDRLEALVSHGEDEPVIETESPERLNRRVVIEVAGFVEEVAALDEGPWWRHQPRPHVPKFKDGPSRNTTSHTVSDYMPWDNGDDVTPTITPGSTANETENNTGQAVEPEGETPTGTDPSTGPSGGPSTVASTSSSTNTSSSTPSSSPSAPNTQTETTESNNNSSENEVGEESTGPSKTKGPKGPDKEKGPKGPQGQSDKASTSNPSDDRLDAGGGNGTETGDPGQSGDHNQANEADESV